MSMKDTTNATGSGNQPVLLRMEGICKSFPGVKALDNVSLTAAVPERFMLLWARTEPVSPLL